ncbi:hypothetical protein KC207_11490 [Phycicoccus sp. BSK3Z-2]|uniref:Uncharacterized protein n=1 Tax=Phycicoccus avicenniae TaxID=2828860 RepID=A0A941I1B7_9MICO|nr:hypothetical protein [Phycicoccus avicenniae]MBR7743914.1 hypothetical protein [Phycicoccus avicenniae]
MQLKDVHENGWFFANSDLGFPFGQDASRFPELNAIHLLAIKALDVILPGTFTAGSIYFVLSFPLTACSMYLLARHEKLNQGASFLAGVLLATIPGHVEGFGHLYISQYWLVPIALWLSFEVARGKDLMSRDANGRPRELGSRTVLTAMAICTIGLSGVYYAAFAMLLVVASALARRVVSGNPADLFRGLGVASGILGVIGGLLALARLSARETVVSGQLPATRVFGESEVYAGKFMDLILPRPGHRLEPLQALTDAYNQGVEPTVEISALGLVGATGFLGLLALIVVNLLTHRVSSPRVSVWASHLIVCFLFYTVGGLGSAAALFLTPQIRTWSRLSAFILAISLLAVGHWLTSMSRRHSRTRVNTVLAVVCIVGVLDQTSDLAAPRHDEIAAELSDLDRYTRQLEAKTSPGCAVFQLPIVPFPENQGLQTMGGYDQLKPYLASADLRFSFGAMRGTAEADWMLAVRHDDIPGFVADVEAVGFCAIEVDSRAFDAATDPSEAISTILGPPVSTARGRTLSAWATRSGRNEDRRRQTLQPVIASLRPSDPTVAAGIARQPLGPVGELSVANLSDQPVDVTVSLEVTSVDAEPRTIIIDAPDGTRLTSSTVATAPTAISVSMTFPPGRTRLPIQVGGPDSELRSSTTQAFVSQVSLVVPPGVRGADTLSAIGSGWLAP